MERKTLSLLPLLLVSGFALAKECPEGKFSAVDLSKAGQYELADISQFEARLPSACFVSDKSDATFEKVKSQDFHEFVANWQPDLEQGSDVYTQLSLFANDITNKYPTYIVNHDVPATQRDQQFLIGLAMEPENGANVFTEINAYSIVQSKL